MKHISAGAVVYRHGKTEPEVIVMYRSSTNTYHLPKGTQENVETTEQTALREVREETGVGIVLEDYLAIVPSGFTRDDKFIEKQTHYFLARYLDGELKPTDKEHDRVFFAPISQALDLLQTRGAHLTLGFENEYDMLSSRRLQKYVRRTN